MYIMELYSGIKMQCDLLDVAESREPVKRNNSET